MSKDKELTQEEIKRLQALKAQWWDTDKQASIRLNWVIEQQENIELEVLDIVLGKRK